MESFPSKSYEEIVAGIVGSLHQSGVLTDTNPGSVVRTLVEAFSREMLEAYLRMARIYDDGFIETASEHALDRLVALLGISRVNGATAQCNVIFRLGPNVSGSVSIARGTRVRMLVNREVPPPWLQGAPTSTRTDRARSPQIAVFETAHDAALDAGHSEASVLVFAQLEEGLLGALSLPIQRQEIERCELLTPIAGVASVELGSAIIERGLQESDAELRARATGLLAAAGGGTARSIERAVLETGVVKKVTLREAGPDNRILRPGEIEVLVDLDPAADPAAAKLKLEQAVLRAKGLGIFARVRGTTRVEVATSVVIRPALAVAGEARTRLLDAVGRAVRAHIDALEPGQALTSSQLRNAILKVDGVADVASANVWNARDKQAPRRGGELTPGVYERLVSSGRPDAIRVGLAASAPVFLQARLRPPGSDPAVDRDAMEAALRCVVPALDASRRLEFSEITSRLKGVLQEDREALDAQIVSYRVRIPADGAEIVLRKGSEAIDLDATAAIGLDPEGAVVIDEVPR